MKYFLDTEFIEGFHRPLFGKKRHFIDLISIGIVCEDGREFSSISQEYNFRDADAWVKENVITPLYTQRVHGDARNHLSVSNFHKTLGNTVENISYQIKCFFDCWRDQHFWRAPEGIEVYGYFSDYDWVLFCSLFGRMIDLPKGFPMYCVDLKQTLDEKGLHLKKHPDYPKQTSEHNALADARWNYELYRFLNNENVEVKTKGGGK